MRLFTPFTQFTLIHTGYFRFSSDGSVIGYRENSQDLDKHTVDT